MAILTDVEKRKQYDQFGPEDERLSSRTHYNNTFREFDADGADEIFNMFFGSGFNGANVYVRRGGRWQRQGAGTQESHHNHHHREVSYPNQVIPHLTNFFHPSKAITQHSYNYYR